MVLTAPMLLTLFRAGMRVATAADHAVAQKIRDEDRIFPSNPTPPYNPGERSPGEIRGMVEDIDGLKTWLTTQDLIAEYNDMLANIGQAGNEGRVKAMNAAVQAFIDGPSPKDPKDNFEANPANYLENAEVTRLTQWLNDPNQPPSPAARFALVLVDVAAEFVAVNPGIVARGSQGEKLVSGFAGRIAELIPNDEKFGPKQRLGGRLLGVVLRAGLETAVDNKDMFATEKHQQDLVDALTGPVLKELDTIKDVSSELKWENVLDAVAGPAASAAFQVIAENQTAFLGDSFASGTLLGELSGQLITTIGKEGLKGTFTEEGAIQLYKAALGVIVDRPELIAPGGNPRADFIQKLVGDLGAVLQKDNSLFSDGEKSDLGAALATAAIEAFRGNAADLLHLDGDPFEDIAAKALDDVLGGLQQGITDPNAFKSIFTRAKTVELVQMIMTEAANQPGMLGNNEEVKNIVAALATAIGNKDGKLLTADGWKQIVATAITQAAANPGRLFGFKVDEPGGELAALTISTFLTQAADSLTNARASGGVLFGDTLIAAMQTTLITFASDPENAQKLVAGSKDSNLLAQLISQVSKAIKSRAEGETFSFGAKEWQRVYRALLLRLMSDATTSIGLVDGAGELTPAGKELIDEILKTVVPIGS